MSTLEDIKTAEITMREAEAALRSYRKMPAADEALIRQLAAELKSATQKYVNLVLSMSLDCSDGR